MSLLKIKKVLITLILFTLFSTYFFAESFRVRKVALLDLTDFDLQNFSSVENYESESVSVGINDALCIKLPEDSTFIQGIEINIKIPSFIAKRANTIIYSLYDTISPMPSTKQIDYTGKEVFTGIYPGQLSLTIQVPLVKGNTIKKTPYAEKTVIPEHTRNFIFLRNQLAMKGVSNEITKHEFTVSAKPILLNKGRLIIKTNLENEKPTVYIDDNLVKLNSKNFCLLSPGPHTVNVSADNYRNETRTCMIEATKDTVIEISFKSTKPTIKVNMPQGTAIIADNKQVELVNNEFSLSQGEHTLRFTLGGYEIVKQINVQEGKNYTINIAFDAIIKEQ